MKKLHEDTRATIEAQVHRQAEKLNKNKKPMIFKEGDLVRIHLRKERFPEERNSKLKPRGEDRANQRVLPASKVPGGAQLKVKASW